MEFSISASQWDEQDALASARRSTFKNNLAYLHANIGDYMELDVDQSQSRLTEISALIEVLLEQRPDHRVA